ncbi:MAG: zinc-binding dehydrogenase [Chloroflexi bacterium AL-W]|nr:zinc-binding dehydrogenase [Chloroflexi bacterium AL-N1]NOK69731.1 zinc-binding dehydrogenase [Chloroflexi bacterium AL-N10]NOK73665.1 zinc-binding dehydrogenase [Chloroflexi bacterium AL-N5]NOK83901.1 zinc-binding dehydrogenase [Chloroflexi bacterium AL-W]NOK87996.1 zinc-binding dehydrogenase [Chloroflexi bacterium AL-N15]
MQATALLFTDVDQMIVETVTLPLPGPHEVLIETLYTCISPGTELRCLAGKQPDPVPWPFIPGYALVGKVTDCGIDTLVQPGTLVFCAGTRNADCNRMWGGHISHAIQVEDAVVPIPEEVSPLDASIAQLAAIAFHGLRLSKPLPHETVVTIGLGPIGQLAARLYALTGARVVGADRSAKRVALAQAAGIEAVVIEEDLQNTLAPVLPDGADIVVDATGVPAVVEQAVHLAKDLPWDNTVISGARYIVQGSYTNTFAIPYQHAFGKELTFIIPRNAQKRDLEAVLDLLQRHKFHVGDLIGEAQPPETAPQIYAALQESKGALITAAFRWRE